MDSPDLSAIDKDSFMEDMQRTCGNPFHSTAMGEDLDVVEEGPMRRGKTAAEKRKRKRKSKTRSDTSPPEKEKKRSMQSSVSRSGAPPPPTDLRRLVEKPPPRRSARLSASRPVQSPPLTAGRTETPSSSSDSSGGGQSEEERESGTRRRRSRVLSSDEDEETSWKPSPKTRKPSLGRTSKASSDWSKPRKPPSGEAEERRRRPSGRAATDLEVALDAFLDFCHQYRESVESASIQRSIDCFSSNVEEQLLEKISSSMELKVLKRQNNKVRSLIQKNTRRLLEAKQELMRAERQLWLLQKENSELQQTSADLKQGRLFLHDLGELSRKYLEHRRSNPAQKETYGASSLPALLLETKLTHGSAGTDP